MTLRPVCIFGSQQDSWQLTFKILMNMARTDSKLSAFKAQAESGGVPIRPIGGRVLLPGEYVFDVDPAVRYDVRTIRDTNNTYLQLEVKSSKGWVDVSTLMKRTKDANDNTLVYVNDWIQQYADVVELAEALAGNKLTVSYNKVPIYSTYKDGQTVPAYVTGIAYKATLSGAAAAKEVTPAPAEPADEQ